MAGRDTAGFAEFVSARSGALHRAAYLMVGDEALAQGLVQEALTKVYVAWPRLRDTAKAEPYARRTITTTAISWFRRKGWNGERPTGTVPERAAPDRHDDQLANRDWLWSALQGLPPRQRIALVLRFYEDLSEAQTAEAMGCAVGTVKSQVSAGIRKLRDQLGPDADLIIPNEMVVTR